MGTSDDRDLNPGVRSAVKGRSPSYPGISLEEAERRARELYSVERQHSAPVSAIVQHWGYSPTSSGGRIVIAALKKFGLLDDEGSGDARTARLTNLALEILLNPEPGDARRKAALMPRFHREVWEQYGHNLPSLATLRYRLIREFAFTESGADEFIAEYQATIEYAMVGDANADVSQQAPSGAEQTVTPTSPSTQAPSALGGISTGPAGAMAMTIPIPLLDEGPVILSGSFPLSEAGWDQLIRVLQAMRPGLVRPAPAAKNDLPPTASPSPEA